MPKYRVVRVLEYVYDSRETFDEDYMNWTHTKHTSRMDMVSVVVLPGTEVEDLDA